MSKLAYCLIFDRIWDTALLNVFSLPRDILIFLSLQVGDHRDCSSRIAELIREGRTGNNSCAMCIGRRQYVDISPLVASNPSYSALEKCHPSLNPYSSSHLLVQLWRVHLGAASALRTCVCL